MFLGLSDKYQPERKMKESRNPFRHTRLCAGCGRPTALLVHDGCAERFAKKAKNKPARKARKKTSYPEGFIKTLE
ncbi:MAG: hypothetical protein WC835_00185 [Candidatus Paceibacterota bacterium]|jgi:hypothetical protein